MRLLLLVLFLSFTNVNGQNFPNPANLSTGQGVPGSIDPIWLVSQLFTSTPPNPMGLVYSPALINNNCAPGAWVSPSALPAPINNGNWITQNGIPCGNGTNGFIYFRLQLNLPTTCNGSNIATSGNYTLYLSGYVDDIISDVFVNGISQGVSGGSYGSGGQLNITLNNSWTSGLNYVDVLVRNTGSGPYGLLLVANYSASLNSDLDGDGIADLNDNCPCQFGGLPDGCCTTSIPTATSTQTFCNAANVSNLIATGTNINWYTSATGGSALAPTTSLSNGTTYYASQTVNGCESPVRLPVIVNISSSPTPSGSSTQTFCNLATVASLIATGTNIQWYANSTGGTPLSNATLLVNGSTYYASQTLGGCESTTRLAVTVNINNPQITATSNTICLGESSTLTAFNTNNPISNSCSMPTNLQNGLVGYWPFCGNANDESGNGNNGTVTGATLTADRFGNANNAYTFDGNDFIETNRVNLNSFTVNLWLNLTSFNCFSALIDAYPSSWEFLTDCNTGTNLSSAIWNNTSTYQIYQSNYIVPINTWTQVAMSYENNVLKIYANGIIVISTPSVSPPNVNGFYYFGRSKSGADQFLDGRLDDISIWDRALTQQEIQQLYNQSITTYLWSTGETTATISVSPSTTTNYWVDFTNNGVTCRKNITINVNSPTASPTGASTQTFCNSASVSSLNSTGTNIQWYTNAVGGTPLSNTTALLNGTTYYASQTISGCESLTRFPVNVIINTPASPTGNSNQLFCNSATVSNLTITGQNIQWYTTATGGTPLTNTTSLINGSTYYASQTINGCESLIRKLVLVTIIVVPIPTGSSVQEFCKIDNPIVSNLTPNLPNIKWYTTLAGGNPLNPNNPLIDNASYFAEAIDATTGCKSPNRLEVLVKINDSNPPAGELEQIFCVEDNPTISNLIMNTSNTLVWYDSAAGNNIVVVTTPLSNGDSFYASNFDSTTNCYSSVRTKVDITLLPCELEINNLLTLNGNNLNDFIVIKNIETFPKNEFQIFNRYGKLVWRGYNYNNLQNTFTGKANVQGVYNSNDYLPTGTYFYVLTYFDMYRDKNKEVKGFLQINNNQ